MMNELFLGFTSLHVEIKLYNVIILARLDKATMLITSRRRILLLHKAPLLRNYRVNTGNGIQRLVVES